MRNPDRRRQAVSMLHRGERRTLTTKQVRKAEAVALVVSASIGPQTGTASADYIQLWQGDAKLLQEGLQAVQETAAVILGGDAPEIRGISEHGLPIVPGKIGMLSRAVATTPGPNGHHIR